jgi:hypothetical protein
MHSIDDMFKDIFEWGSFHDVINEVRYLEKYCNYDVDTIRAVFDKLPETIKDQAQIWGLSDTVVRDDAYVYLKDHPEIINDIFSDNK